MTNGTIQFQPAQKSKCKLRCAIFGPSGSGKTMSALRIATGMGGKIAVIDTEFGSASKYADRFKFDAVNLDSPNIDTYIQAMDIAAKAGYEVLIIDSASHGWQELLTAIDQLAKTKYKGNSWSAWCEGTPKQREFVNAIQSYPGHVIATMRSKTEWQTETNNGGKMRPIRVGLTPEQGKGIEYEFDMLIELNVEHACQVIKDRTGKYQDKIIDKPGEDFGKELVAWLNNGAEVKTNFVPAQAPQQPAQAQPPAPQASAPPAPPAASAPQNNFNPPPADAKSEPILVALADHYKKEIPPGYQFNDSKMRQAIFKLFGKYPTQPAGATKVKQKITGFDVCDKVAA
jgi:hypothetical protein